MQATRHGTRRCDTMGKARAWREAHGFHDGRVQGLDRAVLEGRARRAGSEALLTRAGTPFRGLPGAEKARLGARRAIALMPAQPGLIRRPVPTAGDRLVIGCSPARDAVRLGGG